VSEAAEALAKAASLMRATTWPQSCNFTRTFINVGEEWCENH
jgi:hypothetical protein